MKEEKSLVDIPSPQYIEQFLKAIFKYYYSAMYE